ncbi:MAG: hypothetical protein CM15mP77_3590 [Synechococcus sp.]|nr:MAG: hypothetical protein CM15mP77_3590 [Synechococcus sp.]
MAALATAKASGYNQWQQARSASDFSQFAPALQRLIHLRQEQARQLAEPRSCWETLAQPFEPDLSLQRLQEVFAPATGIAGTAGRNRRVSPFQNRQLGSAGDGAATALR